ncbi:MAG: hypothetical protein WKF73_21445 [Nocardioidaceae bacterium]
MRASYRVYIASGPADGFAEVYGEEKDAAGQLSTEFFCQGG